jgi:hypothetical protein
LLSLRDATMPYPVDLQVANGPTHDQLVGTVQDPLKFAGTADVTPHQVELADLGGFLGSEPGRMTTPNQTPE